jgi:hypothetical protein
VTPADELAAAERLARALAWLNLADGQRALFRATAGRLLEELADDARQGEAIYWAIVAAEDPEP